METGNAAAGSALTISIQRGGITALAGNLPTVRARGSGAMFARLPPPAFTLSGSLVDFRPRYSFLHRLYFIIDDRLLKFKL